MRLRFPDLKTSVIRRCETGHPLVVRCHPVRQLRDRLEPFPTLYWLTCPHIARDISVLESAGAILEVQRDLKNSPPFLAEYRQNHQDYIRERWELLAEEEQHRVRDQGLLNLFEERGIGGILNMSSVKCLHLQFAHHLARFNAVGRWIQQRHGPLECRGSTIPPIEVP